MSGRRSGTCGAMSWAGWGALLAALATAGCGSGGETPGPITDPGGADRPGGDALPDGLDALPDGGDDAEPADAEGDGTGDGGWDGGGDGGGDGVTPPDGVEPDANGDALPDAPQCPGGAGCPCGKNDDCVSGMCLESSDGWVCTQLCAVTESCPAGWVCVTMISGPDVVQVCADPFARLCRPCRTDADCAGAAGAGGDAARCLPRGAEGSFCGTACDGADECPEGYECLEAAAGAGGDRAGGDRAGGDRAGGDRAGGDRAGSKQCVPADGAACPCTPWFEHAQYETDCFVENGLGRCTAARTCGEPCPALAPAAETCDGRDEDCDGDTDEGVDDRPCELENEHGTCTGTGTCVAGKLLCQGEYPSPESCDGKDDDCDGDTDEGFPDTNGDGVADCVDEDLDGDGVKNLDDNCLEVPNPDQSDTDQDGDGDLCDSDDDNDGIPDLADNCRHVPNPFQQDCDKDGAGDACEDDADADGVADAADNCPDCKWNPGQEDADADGAGDACDPDDDGDFVPDAADNCPLLANGDQADTDKDGAGDACDPDDDGDGVADGDDNCPLHANADQSDLDQDGPGDACDEDKDGDTIPNGADNCPGTPNPDQIDENENQVGDACEDDWDGDGVANGEDNCAWVANAGQGDMDLDGAGDACDCDADGDGLGNDNPKCAPPVPADNCAWIANPGQEDADADGIGDACDPDRDGDGDPNGADCAPDDPTVGHGAAEVCDGTDDDCDGATDEQGAAGCATFFLDADQDGWGTDDGRCLCAADGLHTATRKGDCRDQDAAVSPGVEEACNSIDDDCDKVVDEEDAVGCTTFYRDLDQDKYGPTSDARCLCAALKPYTAELPGDCNDLDDSVKPGGTEKCNKKDDDCSGAADEPGAIGCSLYFADADGDGFGVAGSTICVCVPAVPFTATKAGDCNDGDATSYPGSAERCNGLDDDCDGAVDEDGASGCSPYFLDADRDGFGGASASVCKCQPAAPYDATKTGDCNDNDPSISPGAGERCNARDDNCDGAIDEEGATGCTAWWLDADQDGAGAGGQSKCLCAPAGKYTAAAGSDCNDADKAVYPGAAEACNAKDDDCDGVVDEAGATGCQSYWRDGDLDGWGVSGDMRCGCGPDPQYSATKTGDCNDADAGVNPGVAERCGNAVDEDCDGQTSEPGCVGCTTYWQDADHDDWGTGAGSCLEAPSGNMTALKAGDCNDADPLVNPAAPEKCNLKDDDCNGATDGEGAQGCSTYHLDQDQDLYGTDASSKCLCAALGQYTALSGGDCNDADKAVHPGVVESCNQKDDDCDGTADEDGAAGCVQRFPDADHDTWGVSGGSRCTCAPAGDLTATRGGDCDDGDAAVMPGAAEACNGRDDDCDGQTDEEGTAGCTLFYADADADGYGAAAQSKCLCAASGVFKVTQPGDCNDADYNVNPGRPEVCNGRDDDCDGQQDAEGAIGCTAYFTDADDDRFGTGSQTRCLCAASGTWRATVAGDCDDALATVNPAATESCNGRDDDCNGVKDEAGATGCVTYFLDADGDAWGVTGQTQCLCAASGQYTALVGQDCADNDAAVRPGATEACNTKDDDCDGTADEAGATGCTAFYLDADADTWGVTGQTQCLCALSGNWRATRGGDCDDADALVNPAAAELCGPRDENCDSVVLPDCLFTQRSSGLPTQTLGTIPALSGKRIRVTTLGICGDSDSSSGPNRFTAAGGGQTFSWAAGQSYVSATYTLAPTPVVSGSYRRGFSYLNVDHVTTAGAGMTVQWDYHYDWDSKYCSTQDVLGNSYSDPSSTVRAWVRYRYE